MKKIIVLFLAICGVSLNSCYTDIFTVVGFNSPINKNSKGTTIMDVVNGRALIHLDGIVIVNEGEVNVELECPNGDVIYSKNIKSADSLHINNTYNAQKGYWKLRYTSIQGTGVIDLHLKN